MAIMLPEKKRRLARPLYRENTRQGGMLSKTLRKKKRHKAQHAKKNKNHERKGRIAAPAPHPTNP